MKLRYLRFSLIPSELSFRVLYAEREGFEPPVPLGTAVFKTAVIDHSTISPDGISKRKAKNEVFARRFCDNLSAKVIHTCEICKLLRTFCGFFVLKRTEERIFGRLEEGKRGGTGDARMPTYSVRRRREKRVVTPTSPYRSAVPFRSSGNVAHCHSP